MGVKHLPATAPTLVRSVSQNPPPSTLIFIFAPMNGGAELPKSGGWKLIPQYCGTEHSFTVYGLAT